MCPRDKVVNKTKACPDATYFLVARDIKLYKHLTLAIVLSLPHFTARLESQDTSSLYFHFPSALHSLPNSCQT